MPADRLTKAASFTTGPGRPIHVQTLHRASGKGSIAPSVGSVGDACDHALAETINDLYKTEVIRRRKSWHSIDQVEMETLKWVDWFNHRRLLEPIGNVPPAEAE
jgi:putative transposase